jgi:arachidonate 15-lipoxygenase
MKQPCLPQHEPNAEPELNSVSRTESLSRQREAYQYDRQTLPPLVFLDKVPSVENFSSQYTIERLAATTELIPNMLGATAKSFLDPLDTLQDYEDFFTLLKLPEVAKVYQTNNSFAEQRLSGVNPMAIEKLAQGDTRAQLLDDPSFQANIEPLFDLPKELAQGNIYITDYTGTDPDYIGPSFVRGGSHEKGRKYLPKPLAFFWWRSIGIGDRGKLVPIAIQLNASKDPNVYQLSDAKIYTPFEQNPLDWLFAKVCVQIADANHHEMSTHLCRTHFVMEPIAIATARQLAENHPLSILLKPHFLFMLANNDLGQKVLINNGGLVDRLLAGNLPESMKLVEEAAKAWDINKFAFPDEIKNRGMMDIPHYPYRDDGMLVWNAIDTFVSKYLTHFYPTSTEIVQDNELQAWTSELADRTNGGNVNGMPAKIESIEQLIKLATTIIFTCGPQHSAVNFSQYEYMGFVPNMPLAAYQDIPDPREKVDEQKILNLLPPYKRSADQLQTLFVLSAYKYDRLGHYDRAFAQLYNKLPKDIFDGENKAVLEMMNEFQQDLNIAEQRIDERNQKRSVPYPYLKPSAILNSISI